MAKTNKKLTKEEKLAKDRLRKRNKYNDLKSDPELYRIHQEKERERYLKKKEKKTVVSIKDMSARAQREQRRRWKKKSLNYIKKKKEQKNIQRILLENSPPDSENEGLMEERHNNEPPNNVQPTDPLASTSDSTPMSHQQSYLTETVQVLNQRLRRLRYDNMKMNKELMSLKKECAVLRKNKKQTRIVNQSKDTVEKNVDTILEDIRDEKKVEAVKKKLIFTENLAKGFLQNYNRCNKKDKRNLAQSTINKDRMKKHRVLSKLPYAHKRVVSERNQQKKITQTKQRVQTFFEEDVNSQIAAGKKEYIKRGGVKKQKRYLADNLKNLHDKYCKQWGYISYSVFCRYRPFWVNYPSNQRDTCQCKIHANIELLIKSLKKSRIINECSATEVLTSLCCDSRSDVCLDRSCRTCDRRVLHYKEFDDSECITYYEWISEKQKYTTKNGKELYKNVTIKKKREDRPRKIIQKLELLLNTFFKHQRNIVVQYTAIKDLKENLEANEVVCHVDFSENFCFKYHEEIQSFHFGGSRGQVSLHTGVMYYIDEHKDRATKSFCSMSQCLNHDASAIWAHIIPVIELAQRLVPPLTTIHFVSDSPSSQYRNRYIFNMLTKLNHQFPKLREVTWSYLEAGHGKGAPDGVGAVVKRTGDSHVKYGGDISSFQEFVEVVQKNVENVEFFVIPEEEVTKQRFPAIVLAFKGTTKVHQVLWSSDFPYTQSKGSNPQTNNEAIQSMLCELTGNFVQNDAQQEDVVSKMEPYKVRKASSQTTSQCEIEDKENIRHSQYDHSKSDREDESIIIGSWVVVEYKIKQKYKHYIGQVTDIQDNEYTLTFLRHVKDLSFTWPVEPDIDIVDLRSIKNILLEPSMNRRAQVIFKEIHGKYNIE